MGVGRMVAVAKTTAVSSHDEVGDIGDRLIDVSELSLGDLEEIDGSTLAQALRRVLGDEQAEPVAGFQSNI
jgi:FXSXX-COOH protein